MRCGWSGRTCDCAALRPPVEQAGEPFRHQEEDRHEKDPDRGRGEHATDDAGADGVQAIHTRTGGDHKRYRA